MMNMKTKLKVGVGVVVVLVAATAVSTAWSQPGDTTGASGASATLASDGMKVKSDRRANRALQKQIYAAIAKHKEIDAGSISVKANDGTVSINGTVLEADQIDTLTEIAKSVPGVTSVATRLSVQRPLGQ
jgi:osmotically-inducible protein OsmY